MSNETKVNNYFVCDICNYKYKRKYDYEKHLLTQKHINQNKLENKLENNIIQDNNYTCNCGKIYKHKQSLNRHIKTCSFINKEKESNENNENNEDIDYKKMLLNMIKENNELRKQVTELIPKVGNNNINQKFNIQVFLNEECKNAINMEDFIKSIEISIEQLDFTKTNGLSEGLSNAIVENMNKLSIYERPMHCTDLKREILYIKDDNIWTKDESKNKLKKIIKKTSGKNYDALQNWIKNNPDYMEDEHKKSFFTNIISTIGKDISNLDTNIIKNICKETYIKDNI